MSNKVKINKSFLQKVAQFTKVAVTRIQELEANVAYLQKKKQAEEEKTEAYYEALEKVASVLYDADFLLGRKDQKEFLKRASDDPIFLANTLIKVCKANDVKEFGEVVEVAGRTKQAAYDPVYARVFGGSKNSNDFILDVD